MSLLSDLLAFGTGRLYEFSIVAWLFMTAVLLLVGPVLTAVARPIIDPVAVVVALRPGRAVAWAVAGMVVVPAALALLAISIIGTPLTILGAIGAALLAGLGYLAAALVWGDRLARLAGGKVSPPVAMAVGLVVFRLLRLIPVAGAGLHSLLVLFGFGAGLAVTWDVCRSWYRRRLPDEVQFAGEDIIEWTDVDPGPAPPPS